MRNDTIFSYVQTYMRIDNSSLVAWLKTLRPAVLSALNSNRWGDLPRWLAAVEKMPHADPTQIDLNSPAVSVGNQSDMSQDQQSTVKALLKELHPWRKGPFHFFGIDIDTEWRSDLKWDRLKDHIAPLDGRTVLDVGCGNGYHCWRMAGAGAGQVYGIDPTMLYVIQFQLMQKYINKPEVNVFPIGIDDMPEKLEMFDTVFSMGLLYHRRAPFDHLLQLKSLMRPGGEMVLETLVIEGQEGEVLSPTGRYAKMPNVWFIPSVKTLNAWIARMGFQNVRCVDVTKTTSDEQRVTEWMGFHSLNDFLDPKDSNLTIEGYPAPRRAVFIAQKEK